MFQWLSALARRNLSAWLASSGTAVLPGRCSARFFPCVPQTAGFWCPLASLGFPQGLAFEELPVSS